MDICGCVQQLPATQRVQEFLITRDEILIKKILSLHLNSKINYDLKLTVCSIVLCSVSNQQKPNDNRHVLLSKHVIIVDLRLYHAF